jgi:phosphatidylserine decarboxylase
MKFLDWLLTVPQYIAPQRSLSKLVWRLSRLKHKTLKSIFIRFFRVAYNVDLAEAIRQENDDYESFNDFFTRELLPEARPAPPNDRAILSPADGVVSQIGQVRNKSLVQAKGRNYSLEALLADDRELAKKFTGGNFATIYLAPHNYHRVHAPIAGTVEKVRYVPGKLFSVNNRTARCVDNLFARNERIIVELSTEIGSVAVILVGAMLVASMDVVGCKVATEIQRNGGSRRPFDVPTLSAFSKFKSGEELGRFNMGSTVILLFEPGRIAWDKSLEHSSKVQIRQSIGSRVA